MRLRKQLFFLSLVTLALPWVGCQAIREMDQSLRIAQLNTLNATASAVAARFASDPVLSDILAANAQHDSGALIYAHSFSDAIYLDGYGDDWLGQGIALAPLPSSETKAAPGASFATGVSAELLYGFIKVKTPRIRYFRPSDSDLSNSDYLRLDTATATFAIFASAPGRIRALRLDGGTKVDNRATAHEIQGFWLESDEGFQLEFSMPLELAIDGLELHIINAASVQSEPRFGEGRSPATIAKLITPSPALSDELGIFTQFDTRLHIINPHRYRLASAGRVQQDSRAQQTHGLLAWLYAKALGKTHFTALNNDSGSGKMAGDAIEKALTEGRAQAWHKDKDTNIAQVGVAIVSGGNTLGAVVAEQSESSLRRLTDSAFGRLLSYSFLASILAALCLVAFATVLSIRIRRLNDAALSAISEGGKIAEHFPVSNSGDEIGELSRSYDQLLARLREYTQYLRTLSSKLSHELRTPLAIVRTSLDNLEHENLSDKAAEYSNRAREGASRLSHIINAMSAASRVEQAIEHADLELIVCARLLKDLVEAYASVYPHVRFSLRVCASADDARMRGSPELLVQALDKLVDNAVDFSPPGEQITIELAADKNALLIRVHNRGPLLPDNMRGQLFDSLVSLRPSNSLTVNEASVAQSKASIEDHAPHHLGLGLYIVRLICDFHAGEARAYNADNRDGVVFELRLPAHQGQKIPQEDDD